MLNNRVSPSFVRHVRHGVRHRVRHQTRANTGMCGMCGITRTRAHECKNANTDTRAMCSTHAHVNTYRTYRTYRTTPATARLSSVRHVFSYPAQPAQKKFEGESRMEKPSVPPLVAPITCGPDNVPFNAGSGSAARFFYCPKANRKDRNEGCEGLPQRVVSTWGGDEDDLSEGKKSTFPKGNHHPTVKPTDLMRYLCRLVTPPGGVVLDPFTGSGSTGKAAILEGFSFIGCELLNDHADIAEARMQHALGTAAQDLFFGIHQAA